MILENSLVPVELHGGPYTWLSFILQSISITAYILIYGDHCINTCADLQ